MEQSDQQKLKLSPTATYTNAFQIKEINKNLLTDTFLCVMLWQTEQGL